MKAMLTKTRTVLTRTIRRSWRPLLVGLLLGALFALFALRPSSSSPPHSHLDHSAHESSDAPSQWTCSMHPQIRRNEPGQCPICGMDLIPVNGGATSPTNGAGVVKLSPRARKLAQLRTVEVVRKKDPNGELRLLGRIEPNEQTQKTVTAWIGGRIDRLFVKTTGEKVHAGQTVASLYSPEVFSAHQDLIVASTQLERMKDASETAKRAAEAALAAARQRLSLLGVPDDEISRMQKATKPTTSVSIRSPFSGTVLERFATEGSYVTTGARLYSLAQLDSLWLQLDAYESDLPLLSEGQKVDVEVEAFPGESFEGKVTFIEPTLDERLRTSKVRVVVNNEDGRLRPGMFAQAVVASDKGVEGAPLVIPASAPLFTGRRAIVYVEVPGEDGLAYEARTVRLGPRLGDVYPVVAGLAEGERIVQRGAFALDADLQIKGGSSMMASPDDTEPGTWDEVIQLPQAKLRPLRQIVIHYLEIQRALAADDLGLAKQTATSLGAELSEVDLGQTAQVIKTWQHLEGMLSGGASHIAQADTLEQARKGFEHLSGAIIMLLRAFGNPTDTTLALAHCPMARGSQGANWIQEGDSIKNSYFGEAMRTCGAVQENIEPGAHLTAPSADGEPAPGGRPSGEHSH